MDRMDPQGRYEPGTEREPEMMPQPGLGSAPQPGYDEPTTMPGYDTEQPSAPTPRTGSGYPGTPGYAGPSAGGAFDPWNYRESTDSAGAIDIVGYKVEASDGSIGKIDEASSEVGASYLVVDTGPWIFGRKVMLPAGIIDRIDRTEQKVFVSCSKQQIKNSPDFDEASYTTPMYRDKVGDYYRDNYGSSF